MVPFYLPQEFNKAFFKGTLDKEHSFLFQLLPQDIHFLMNFLSLLGSFET